MIISAKDDQQENEQHTLQKLGCRQGESPLTVLCFLYAAVYTEQKIPWFPLSEILCSLVLVT